MEDGIARSPGHCMTMGTASTMTSADRGDGLHAARRRVDSGGRFAPRADGEPRPGRRIVDMVWEDLKPRDIVTAGEHRQRDHRRARARRLDQRRRAHGRDRAARRRAARRSTASTRSRARTPLVANVRPAGKYLMEDFYYAGGLRALLASRSAICSSLDASARRTAGRSARTSPARRCSIRDVILPRDKALVANGQPRRAARQPRARRRGDQARCGGGASSAAHGPGRRVRRLQRHGGAHRRSRARRSRRTRCSCCKHAGPLGAPGMPEWGQLPIPKKILAQGVRDMVRISDARMSGTSYGACVLHVAPESYVGGPLALVRGRRHDRARRAGAPSSSSR